MPLIEFSKSGVLPLDTINCELAHEYSTILLPDASIMSMNKFFKKYDITSNNILRFDYKAITGNSPDIRAKYRVTDIYFTRQIHNASKSHDVEMIIKNELISGDPYNSYPSGKYPIKIIYQIFLFKNNNDKPMLVDLNNETVTPINGNKFFEIHRKNNMYPVIYFLNSGAALDNFLPSNDKSSAIFLWNAPINEYQIKNYKTIMEVDTVNPINALLDWGTIFIDEYGLSSNQDFINKLSNTNITYVDKTIINNSYIVASKNFKYETEIVTDDVYIDCSPINESVEHVNHYLEKLNGKDDSTKKKVMEMIINSLIIVIVSGSVFFSAPTICENILKIHLMAVAAEENSIKNPEILYGIEFGIGFEFLLIAIILLAVGYKNKEALFAGLIFLLILFSFLFSVGNSNSGGILKQYIGDNPIIFSANMLLYALPLPIPFMILKAISISNSIDEV